MILKYLFSNGSKPDCGKISPSDRGEAFSTLVGHSENLWEDPKRNPGVCVEERGRGGDGGQGGFLMELVKELVLELK